MFIKYLFCFLLFFHNSKILIKNLHFKINQFYMKDFRFVLLIKKNKIKKKKKKKKNINIWIKIYFRNNIY